MLQQPLDSKIPAHERVKFYEQRAQAFQNLFEIMLPPMFKQVVILLKAREAMNKAETALGVTPSEMEEARLKQLEEAAVGAFPHLKGKSIEEMVTAINAINKRKSDNEDRSS